MDEAMELLGYLLTFFAGWIFASIIFKHRFERAAVEMEEAFKAKAFTNIDIEMVDDEIFVYDTDTKEFLAKGATRREVEDALRLRYPNKSFLTSHDDFTKLEDAKQ
jgi:hypothetical protein